MNRDHIPRAIALCFIAVPVALFLHLPLVIFPSSLLPVYHTRYYADAQQDNLTLLDHDASYGSLQHLLPVPSPLQKGYAHLHQRKNHEDAFLSSITKGWGLCCLMEATTEEAPRMVQNSPKWKTIQMESKFIDPLMAPLEWGWNIKTLDLMDTTEILYDYKVDKMLEFLHVSTELRFWTQQLVSHEREWYAEDGRTGPVRAIFSHVHTYLCQATESAEMNRPLKSHLPLAAAHSTNPSSTASTAIHRMQPSFYWKCTPRSPKWRPCKDSASCRKARSTHLTCRRLLTSCS